MTTKMKVSEEVIKVLAASRVDDNILFLPEGQLERKLYVKVNEALKLLGGKWNRAKGGHVFAESPADLIDDALLTGEIENKVKTFQFFPTPKNLAKQVCEMAEIGSLHNCLEPSAGRGNIADEMLAHCPNSVTVVELNAENESFLAGKYTNVFIGQDFLTWETNQKFDRIVMNPPFAKKQDIKHILRAWNLLAGGGILVAILSPSPFYCNDKTSAEFLDFLNRQNATVGDFGEGEFKESGTSIRTKWIKVVKNG